MEAKTAEVLTELIVGLAFGFLISWSVGLMPAIVYRYIFFKAPIDGRKVFWRLAPFVIIIGLAFKLINSALFGQPPSGNPIPWIIIYYIGKWIMTRRPKRNKESSSQSHIGRTTSSAQDCESCSPRNAELIATQPPAIPITHHKSPHTDIAPANGVERSPAMRILFGCVIASISLVACGYGIYRIILFNTARQIEREIPRDAYVWLAACARNMDVLDSLLNNGGDPDQRGGKGHTALIASARHNDVRMIARLLDAGADPNLQDDYGWTALHHTMTAEYVHLDAMRLLISRGAEVNAVDKRRRTPLHRAAMFGHIDAARILLDNGAHKYAKDYQDWTPYDRALLRNEMRNLLK